MSWFKGSEFRVQSSVLNHGCFLTPETRNPTLTTMSISITEANTEVDVKIVDNQIMKKGDL